MFKTAFSKNRQSRPIFPGGNFVFLVVTPIVNEFKKLENFTNYITLLK